MTDVVNTRHLSTIDRDQTLYVGRGSPWGNQYPIIPGNPHANRDNVIQNYLRWVLQMNEDIRKEWDRPVARALQRGMKLRCFCAPEDCHAMILAAFARADHNLDPLS